MANERVLVTGAAGFIGKHLVKRLAEDGFDVTAFDIIQQPPEYYEEYVGDEIRYLSGSILHEEFVRTRVFHAPKTYDRIFHLAAIVGVDRYLDVDDPLYITDVNINGTKLLLELARGSDARFVYTSTSEIYGKNPDVPWAEDDDRILGAPTKSRWSYSANKAVCEHMIHMIGETDPGLSTTVVRPFNLYGPHQRASFVIPKFLQQVAEGNVPTVYGDGTQRRCFTFIDDFVEGLIAASEREAGLNETYNLGNTDETEIRDLAELVLDIAGMSEKEPKYVEKDVVHNEDYEEPDRRVPDITNAREKLDWSAETSLEEGLRQTYSSLK